MQTMKKKKKKTVPIKLISFQDIVYSLFYSLYRLIYIVTFMPNEHTYSERM